MGSLSRGWTLDSGTVVRLQLKDFIKNHKWYNQKLNHLIFLFTSKHPDAEKEMLILNIKDLPAGTHKMGKYILC